MSRKNKLANRLGLRIRGLRRQKKITLIELSELTGIAQATLSRIETGLMIGTVKSHQKIAETLGVGLAELYETIDNRHEKTKFQTASEPKKILTKTEQMKCELLTQEVSKKKITPLLITLAPQGKSQMERSERGVEKCLFVLEGSVKAMLDREEYLLNSKDTLYFDGSIPHQLINPSHKETKIFCAVSSAKI